MFWRSRYSNKKYKWLNTLQTPTQSNIPTAVLNIQTVALPTLQEAVVEEAPVEEAPVEEAPVEEAPVEEAVAEEAVAEEAPVEEAPVEEAPVEEAVAEEAPADTQLEVPVELSDILADIQDKVAEFKEISE